MHKDAWSEVELAYLAGYIDADGMIGLWKISSRGNRSGLKYRAAVEVDSCRPEILEQFQHNFGGKVYLRLPKGRNGKMPRARPISKWRLNAEEIRRLLPQVLPFLRAKKRQGEIILSFLESTKPRQKQTEESLHFMEKLKAEITTLNKRGL
jgi:hypothetical protein